jgi:hypothetical protein
MSSSREGLELTLAHVLPKAWMIPPAIRLALIPKVVDTRFHFRHSRNQQSITLLYFSIRILGILTM